MYHACCHGPQYVGPPMVCWALADAGPTSVVRGPTPIVVEGPTTIVVAITATAARATTKRLTMLYPLSPAALRRMPYARTPEPRSRAAAAGRTTARAPTAGPPVLGSGSLVGPWVGGGWPATLASSSCEESATASGSGV